jgi:hypothetical protein
MAWGLAYPALLVSVINVSLNLAYRRRVGMVASAVESAARDLGCWPACWLGWNVSNSRRPGLLNCGPLSNRRGCLPRVGLPEPQSAEWNIWIQNAT